MGARVVPTCGLPRIVVVGAGVAGSLITAGLADRDDIDLVCLERAGRDEHADAGTGLNIGPNAMACLALHLPRSAEAIVAHSLPWRRWQIALTNGRPLMDLPLDDVASTPGIRIRWSELYALLRQPIGRQIQYGAEMIACAHGPSITWQDRTGGGVQQIEAIDLLIAADGRYSAIRKHVLGGLDAPHFLGVCLYRVLFPAGPDCPIDDYGQWFNGANRLLAYRVPGTSSIAPGRFPSRPATSRRR